jgi:hypothetical protein
VLNPIIKLAVADVAQGRYTIDLEDVKAIHLNHLNALIVYLDNHVLQIPLKPERAETVFNDLYTQMKNLRQDKLDLLEMYEEAVGPG